MVGCPTCASCGAEPHLVSEDCDKCWNCERDEGVIRGAPDVGGQQDIRQREKKVEVISR
jgi:hypothetical protein